MLITNPLDTMRCRWQVDAVAGTRLRSWVAKVMAEEGLWRGLWRPGLLPNVIAMSIAVGGRNGFYPLYRDSIGSMYGRNEKVGPTGMFLAGLCAGVTGYFVGTPFLQVKTQMQVEAGIVGPDGILRTGLRAGHKPVHSSTLDAFHNILSEGSSAHGTGLRGSLQSLWRGAGPVVGRGATIAACNFAGYDFTKTWLKQREYMSDGPLLHFVASQAGALSCTVCSMPFDRVFTTYTSAQTLGGETKAKYGAGGPIACCAAILKYDGFRGFFRGFLPALMRISPSVTTSFLVYEQLRRLVGLSYLD